MAPTAEGWLGPEGSMMLDVLRPPGLFQDSLFDAQPDKQTFGGSGSWR
jgi:hypothetical protein